MDDVEESLRRFLAGDESAFRQIVLLTSARLVRVSARMLGNTADAEDVVQEAYVKAHQVLREGAFDRHAKLETWLYRVVVNRSIDEKRRKKRAPIAGAEVTEALEATGLASAETQVALRELSEMLRNLPEDQQAILIMKSMEGLETKEIADILNTTEGSIEQKLVRARMKLREQRGAS